ncbi:uncharacterized protein BDZ99DRAFT_577341 [Mytilinidion resinicola]|uniref:Uncharacterized protein n=1 Tax=Mytilinidion resinicola TaxID=574789 RepID=A0A6A6XZ03_9PEZI|nr:uncharacterized protein BDZ99DRAFT_577341 [Mytilinidion resinicola]KAF2801640.1 hypothetical protein BDZ99DRAFT_577341 [Mytilinidion resinicola]
MEPHSDLRGKMERPHLFSPPVSPLSFPRGDISSTESTQQSAADEASHRGGAAMIKRFLSSDAQSPKPSSPSSTHHNAAHGVQNPLHSPPPGTHTSQTSSPSHSRYSAAPRGPSSSQHSRTFSMLSSSSEPQQATTHGELSATQPPGSSFSHHVAYYGGHSIPPQSIILDTRLSNYPSLHTASTTPVRHSTVYNSGPGLTRTRDSIKNIADAANHISGDLWWKPPTPDPSMPATEDDVQAIARRFESSIWDVSEVLVPRNGKVDAFKPPKAIYSAADVWAVALFLVNQVGVLHGKGCFVQTFERTTQLKDEWLLFDERVAAMCRDLKGNKSLCESVMRNQNQVIKDLVNAPDSLWRRIVGNAESNKLKAETMRAGQGVLGKGKSRGRMKNGVMVMEEEGIVDGGKDEERRSERSVSAGESRSTALALTSLRVQRAREERTAETPSQILGFKWPSYTAPAFLQSDSVVPLKRKNSDGEAPRTSGKEHQG